MQIAVLTFDGFNELDSFVAAAILNRLRGQGRSAQIAAPTPQVTSMNGVTIDRQQPLEFAADADAVIIGSGTRTREIAADAAIGRASCRVTVCPSGSCSVVAFSLTKQRRYQP